MLSLISTVSSLVDKPVQSTQFSAANFSTKNSTKTSLYFSSTNRIACCKRLSMQTVLGEHFKLTSCLSENLSSCAPYDLRRPRMVLFFIFAIIKCLKFSKLLGAY